MRLVKAAGWGILKAVDCKLQNAAVRREKLLPKYSVEP
jgi:hypothetical protein